MQKTFNKIIDFTHRNFGLIIFLQVILWSFSGFFMYFLDFSDLYNIPPDKPLNLNSAIPDIKDIKQVINKKFPEQKIFSISLKNMAGELYYVVKAEKKEFLISQNQQIIEKVPEDLIKKISAEKYIGNGKISRIELLNESSGNYFSAKPIYRISYDDSQKSEMYINPGNGEVLAKRKALWSFYNTMWEYHLMKYTSNQKLNKNLLLISAVFSLFVSVTGFIKFFKMRLKSPQKIQS
jgi:uncharacterized membrane protein YkoI